MDVLGTYVPIIWLARNRFCRNEVVNSLVSFSSFLSFVFTTSYSLGLLVGFSACCELRWFTFFLAAEFYFYFISLCGDNIISDY